jgi:hypothetical protein
VVFPSVNRNNWLSGGLFITPKPVLHYEQPWDKPGGTIWFSVQPQSLDQDALKEFCDPFTPGKRLQIGVLDGDA